MYAHCTHAFDNTACTEQSVAIALVSNRSKKHSNLVRTISATGAQLLFDSGSAGAIAAECPVAAYMHVRNNYSYVRVQAHTGNGLISSKAQ